MIATVLLALVMAQIGSGQASARDRAESTATVTGLTQVDGTLWEMTVDSPTMGTVPFQVIRPNGAPADAPTLYLLNGAGGGEDGANWLGQTDAQQFFADKFVNVLIPARGLGSYYTDWIAADPRMGQPMWATLLTDELPAAVDDALATNGRNAIAGLSMSATSVLDLATTAPGLYRSVASYSGCARTSTPEGEAAVRGIVYAAAGGNADNMWGPTGSPLWRQHDPYVNAEKLRGTMKKHLGYLVPADEDRPIARGSRQSLIPRSPTSDMRRPAQAIAQGR
uniref:alpha/beta hydrolase n=1 Tax=Mycolicibacterium poriferae TaxID=39694 RepID=UPI003219FF99